MKLSLDTGTATHLIRHYEEGAIWVNDDQYTQDLIVMPESLIEGWRNAGVDQLTLAHFEVLEGHEREILLLGTGRRQHFPPAQLIAELGRRGIGLEVMDTAAACRTYNVLMSEDRRVAAALMMIEPEE